MTKEESIKIPKNLNYMTFNTQVCTTREQSERLLALGLKKETADMCLDDIATGEYRPFAIPAMLKNQIPAWSLHRLLKLLPSPAALDLFDIDDMYEECVGFLEDSIRHQWINKEYLTPQQP